MKKNYKIFKKRIKDICDKYNCTFYNLESSIQDDLWGNKASTNLLSKSDEIDFMHFTIRTFKTKGRIFFDY